MAERLSVISSVGTSVDDNEANVNHDIAFWWVHARFREARQDTKLRVASSVEDTERIEEEGVRVDCRITSASRGPWTKVVTVRL